MGPNRARLPPSLKEPGDVCRSGATRASIGCTGLNLTFRM
jgi:hypothetical protein